jgi:gas vesicle protein
MKEYIRDKTDLLKDDINELKIKHQELKSKDDLQQLVLDQIGKQIDELLPKLVEAVNSKKTR